MSQIDAAKFIIKHTPIGFLNENESYLRMLEPSYENNEEIKKELKNYEEDHFKQVPLSDDKLIISKYNKDKDGFYIDQSKQYKTQINPLSENFEKLEKITNNYPFQKSLDNAINEYKIKYFKKENTAHNVMYEENKGAFKVKVIISSHHISLPNYQSGEWNSLYEINPTGKKGEYTMKGFVKIYSYYYEESNTQFHLNKNVDEIIQSNSNEELIKKIVEIIEKIENKIQRELSSAYDEFSQVYLKTIRRRIAIIGTKFNWSLNQFEFPSN